MTPLDHWLVALTAAAFTAGLLLIAWWAGERDIPQLLVRRLRDQRRRAPGRKPGERT